MKATRRPRRGRPPEFADRVRLPVFMERRELLALQHIAADAGVSASHMARRAILVILAADAEARDAR